MTNVLSMIEQAGVKLEFVKPISIVDGNQTLVLGLIWTLICEGTNFLRFPFEPPTKFP